MHLDQVTYLVGMFLGGGIAVRLYYFIKGRGKREQSVDSVLDTLDSETSRLTDKLDRLREEISKYNDVSNETRQRQETIATKVKSLKEGIDGVRDDTKDNTRAVMELSAEVKKLNKQLSEKDKG